MPQDDIVIDPNVVDDVDPNLPPKEDELVPKSAYEGVKTDLHKLKERNRQLEAELADKKLQGFKDKEDWKSIAETHEQNARELQEKYSGLQGALIQDKKMSALIAEAQKQGINPNSIPDLEMLDFSEVTAESTSTGKILVSGADKAIASLKLKRPHWFTTKVPGINPATPDLKTPQAGGTVTVQHLTEAETKYRKSRSDQDRREYETLIKTYKAQQAGR